MVLQGVFYGVSLPERRSCLSTSYNRSINGSIKRKGGLKVSARTAGAAKTFEVEVDKPLGLTLGQKSNGGVVITVSYLKFQLPLSNPFVFLYFFINTKLGSKSVMRK